LADFQWWVEEFAKLAPLVTTIIALTAASIAYCALQAQKDIARKRASIDFFLKTETDSYMLSAWKEFEAARLAVAKCEEIEIFPELDAARWTSLRNYLNLHELMAVGIKKKVLDDDVCFEFWRGELHRACRDCIKAINYIQSTNEGKETYTELVALHKKWCVRGLKPRAGQRVVSW
jgi:hypothetical protein